MREIDKLNNAGPQGKWAIQYHMPSKVAEDIFFCVDNVGHYKCSPSYRLVRDKYYSFLILCTVAGQGELEYGGRQYRLESDKILFINAYEPHAYYPVSKQEPREFYWLHFDGKTAAAYLRHVTDNVGPVLKVKDSLKFTDAIASIYELKSQKSLHFEMNASTFITRMLNLLLIASSEQTKSVERYNGAVDAALDHIRSYYQQPLHVEQIAEHVHLSTSHFIRLFKERTSCSPYEYLTKYRIMVAKMHLTHSELSVAAIANDVGFPSVNNFITTFKRLEGITPYQYKKNTTMISGKQH